MDPKDNFVAEFEQGYRFAHEITPKEELLRKPISIKHSHPRYEIYYLIQGKVVYRVAGRAYVVHEGDIVIVNAYVLHNVDVSPECDYERYCLEFTASNIPVINGINPINRFFNNNEFISVIPKAVVDNSNMPHILRRMENSYDPDDLYCKHILFSNITLFVVDMAKLVEKEQGIQFHYVTEEGPNHQTINQVIRYINSHIGDGLSVDDIASASGFSKSYLQHMFKDVVGTSISQYLLTQKMQLANFLLQSGEPLQKIASDLGYKYYPTFSVSYKRFFGHPPREKTNS